MNPTTSFAEAARRAFDNLSLELRRSAENDNFVEELEEFIKITDNNDVHEDEFFIISNSNIKTTTTVSLRPQEITLLMLPLMTMHRTRQLPLMIVGNLPPQEFIRKFYLKRIKGRSCPCVSGRYL